MAAELLPIAAEVLRIAIPFRFEFGHSLAQRKTGEGVLLTLRDAQGRVGHGECAPRPYVSGETALSVEDCLARGASAWLGRRIPSFDALVQQLSRQVDGRPRDEHAAACALELALLDLGGKVFGREAGEPLGPVVAPRVRYSGVVSASGRERVLETCAAMRELGVSQAKVKVGRTLEEDLESLAAVREALGEEARLRVDANGAWDAATALERLAAFEPFRLEGLEQPCAADDLEGLSRLTARSAVPVIADESLVSLDDARRLAEARACHVFNVRISKCGGLVEAGRIRDLGRAAGIDSMLGAHVGETAILAAAGRQFAARTPGLRFAEGSYGALLLEADVSDALDLQPGGVGPALEGPGLGLRVDLGAIAAHVVARTTLRD
jgi:muconate cycloisomerase